jgi:HK97 family phage portal protein
MDTKSQIKGVGSLVVFYGLDEGILARGGRTIRTAHELEKSAYNFAQEPAPSMALKSNGVNLPAERITKLLESWKSARQTRSTAFLNADIELQQFGHSPRDLQMVEARQYLAAEIARLCNIPAWYLNADTGSMTYSNVTQSRRDLIDLSIKPFIVAIEQRLSQPDFTPQTQHVRYDLDDFLRGTAEERARVYQILSTIGALSVEEIRQLEDLV